MADTQSSGMRSKLTIGIFIVVVVVIIWQVKGLFGDDGSAPSSTPGTTSTADGGKTSAEITAMKAQIAAETPKPATLQRTEHSPREAEILRLQEETQLKYLTAVNELQMLKVNKEIAETNDAIIKAKLSLVESQKKIINTLAPPPPPPPPESEAKSLETTVKTNSSTSVGEDQAIKYTVVSISRIANRWHAVLAGKGNLYRVTIGDKMPLDNAKVISITREKVILQRNGERIDLTMVPVI